MITNSSVTIYHKTFDDSTRLEKWQRYNYDNVWFFGGQGAGINKGYENANDFDCRLSYELNSSLDVDNFAIGDIVVPEALTTDINTQEDLGDTLFYNITSINDNQFGGTPHIHIGGK